MADAASIPSEEIKLYLKLSQLAYQEQDGFEAGLKRIKLGYLPNQLVYINKSKTAHILMDTQLYLFVNPDTRTCYVVFRGSQQWKDFLTDADFHYVEVLGEESGIKVHCGFHDQYNAVTDDLHSYLTNNRLAYDKVVFTGHSLGAGLATIALPLFWFHMSKHSWKDRKELVCFNYGSPRVGNEKFCAYFDEKCTTHWRTFNNHDIVSKLLPRSAIFDEPYQHINGNALRLYSAANLSPAAFHYKVERGDHESLTPLEDGASYHACDHYMVCLLFLFPSTTNTTLDAIYGADIKKEPKKQGGSVLLLGAVLLVIVAVLVLPEIRK